MKRRNLFVILFMSLMAMQGCDSASDGTKYETENFSIEYPKGWQITAEPMLIKFVPDSDFFPVIYIEMEEKNVIRKDENMFIDATKKQIFHRYRLDGILDDMKVISENGIITFTYETPDDYNIRWYIRLLIRGNKYYFVTVQYAPGNREPGIDKLVKAVESFKLKSSEQPPN